MLELNRNRHEEFYSIMQDLSIFHDIFLSLWKMGKPSFTQSVDTAAVTFDEQGNCLSFLFNPEFWDSIDSYTKSFIICHECLHVILNHGYRMKSCDSLLANYALDVAVNHMLVNSFGFDRNRVNNAESLCWVDTVFKDKVVPDDKNFEYYYMLLEDELGNMPKFEFVLVDSHTGLPIDNIARKLMGDKWEEDYDLGDEIIGELPVDDPGGFGSPGEALVEGNYQKTFIDKKEQAKEFWNKILKSMEKKIVSKTNTQFTFRNRRFSTLDKSFLLPSDFEVETKVLKADVYMFLDCSGSCAHLCSSFFDLANSIDKEKYNVKLFSRTTAVNELIKKSETEWFAPRVGGSDDYRCIEKYIQGQLNKKKIDKYPIVVHFTDGHDCSGIMVNPARPDMWYWLLSTNYRRWVPQECKNVFDIYDIL